MATQYGVQIHGFGLDKLKVVEWLHSLILLKDEGVCARLSELGFPQQLLGLVPAYDMNSLLHLKIGNVFADALNSGNEHYIEAVSNTKCEVSSSE